jgi:hypothetical protein
MRENDDMLNPEARAASDRSNEREPEPVEEKKPSEELNVDAVFAKLKQIGGGKASEEE